MDLGQFWGQKLQYYCIHFIKTYRETCFSPPSIICNISQATYNSSLHNIRYAHYHGMKWLMMQKAFDEILQKEPQYFENKNRATSNLPFFFTGSAENRY